MVRDYEEVSWRDREHMKIRKLFLFVLSNRLIDIAVKKEKRLNENMR